MEHTIDATNKKLGRVATEAATILMGKNNPSFEKNKIAKVKVVISNASKADIRDKKLNEKEYQFYSGYPGGQKTLSMKQLAIRKGFGELFRIAVKGMLPKNRSRDKVMLNLIVTE
jgi:large subunit ribosomal protein L13